MASFTDIEVVEQDGNHYLSERVTDHQDYRPRQYYIDNRPVGNSLSMYGPIKHGGLYQVRTARWNPAEPVDKHTYVPNGNDMQMHVVGANIPGRTGEPGAVPWPDGITIGPEFIRPVRDVIPPFTALPGKLFGCYRFCAEDTPEDYFARGVTHLNSPDGNIDVNKRYTTTGLPGPIPGGYPNVDEMGEERFNELSDEAIDALAAQVLPGVDIAFIDVEKTGKYGDPNTAWSIPLRDETLPKYYRLLRKMRELRPGMRIGEDYRNLIFNRFFDESGQPSPLAPKYLNQYDDPELGNGQAYRQFGYEGQTVSLRDVFNIYGVNAYPDSAYHPDLSRNYFLHQPYAMIHATRITRKRVPASANVIWYTWDGSDREFAFYKLHQRVTGGEVWRNVRAQPPAWFAMYLGLFGDLVADGTMLFHDQAPASTNPDRPFWVPDGMGWNPDQPGNADLTPANGSGNSGAYPREHRSNYLFTMIGKIVAAQLADVVGSGYTLHDCRVNLGTGFSAHNGERQICYSAAQKLPIWVEIRGNNGKIALIGCDPFGMPGMRVPMVVETSRGNKSVSLTGQWPAAFKLNGELLF